MNPFRKDELEKTLEFIKKNPSVLNPIGAGDKITSNPLVQYILERLHGLTKTKMSKVIDKTETTKDGIETVRCGDTLQMLGKSFIQDGVRYFVPMCPHPKEYETITVRGRFCSLCETKYK